MGERDRVREGLSDRGWRHAGDRRADVRGDVAGSLRTRRCDRPGAPWQHGVLGTHRALGIRVAIRVLRRAEQSNWGPVRTRFLLEARTLQIPHPNLLHVRDFGEDERMVYVVTDFIDGPSLREELAQEGHLPFARVQALLAQMLSATAALNARGGSIVGVNPEMIRLTKDGRRDRLVMSSAGISSVQDVSRP